MIKITPKTKTIFLIVGILFFPFLSSEYLFPSLSTEHFCLYMLPNPDAPAMNNELWTCGYSPVFSLIRPVFLLFFGFTLISFLLTTSWTFFKKKPKYIILVLFSWLFFPFVYSSMLNILYQLKDNDYDLFVPALLLSLFLLLWLLPILISFIRYKRKKIDKENWQNNTCKWLKWSIFLYILYAIMFVGLAIFSPLFRLYFSMLL